MFLLQRENEKIVWTQHSKLKMRYYGLSDKRVLKILRKPERIEEGIAPKTVAAMQITGTKKKPTEVWMMYQMKKRKGFPSKITVISAWRYPGRTPEGVRPNIPEDALAELNTLVKTEKPED